MTVLTKVTFFVDKNGTAYKKVAPKVALERDDVEKHEVSGKNGFYLPESIEVIIKDTIK